MDARILQEAIRSATVTYPIPFIFGILLLFAVLCLGGSLIASNGLLVLLAVLGTVSFCSAISLVGYAVCFKPELLRSEQHILSMTMAQIIGDKDMDPGTRSRLSHVVFDPGDRLRTKAGDRLENERSDLNLVRAMDSRTFLVTFDLLDATLDLDGLKTFIRTTPMFPNWWNHIPGVFLVVSDQDSGAISKAIRRFTKDARLLVVETNIAESEGFLPEKSWQWIRRRSDTRINA
jgi:hypothetical protein